MADTKVQNTTTEQQSLRRRQDYETGRDLLGFSPFSMMRRLHDEMDRALSSHFGLSRGSAENSWVPAVEVREREGNLDILAELPGMNKDDVKVEVSDDGLIIQGEKRREFESNERGYHRSERSYGHFYRLIPLPEGVQPEQVKAEFKNGVLQVRVPLPRRAERATARQIPIST